MCPKRSAPADAMDDPLGGVALLSNFRKRSCRWTRHIPPERSSVVRMGWDRAGRGQERLCQPQSQRGGRRGREPLLQQ
jgi:hypothetical protein